MRKRTYDIVHIAIFTTLLSVFSQISIPTVIPFTLQTFGIFLSLLMLGGKCGTLSILLYLFAGCIGLPVFSNFGAGPAYLFGSTGGYVLGFLLIGLSFWFFEIFFPHKNFFRILSLILGMCLCYTLGSFWFLLLTFPEAACSALSQVITICVFPFLLPDLCKLGLAFFISRRLRSLPDLRT